MDLDEVMARAQVLLAAFAHYPGGADPNSIINMASDGDSSWQADPNRMRLNTRALDLLTRLGFIRLQAGGYSYELSETGRSAIDIWPQELSADWLNEWAETEQMLEALDEARTTSTNGISHLHVQNWRQFSEVDIAFHRRVTILTGANGAGKTTLLNILAPHFNWSAQLLTRRLQGTATQDVENVGELRYTNGARSPLIQNSGSGVSNAPLAVTYQQPVPGIFINSHRSVSTYQPLQALPPRFSEWNTIQQQFASEIQVRYSGGSSQFSPLYRMKEALVSAAMHGYGNRAVRP